VCAKLQPQFSSQRLAFFEAIEELVERADDDRVDAGVLLCDQIYGRLLVQDVLNKGILVLTLPVNGMAVLDIPAPERQGMEKAR
jgi:hypothetical protein